MRNSTSLARITALAASLAIVTAGLPAGFVFAQEAPSATLEQATSGEDGSSGSGADVGNASTGNAERDRNGNGGNTSVASAGEGGSTEAADPEAAPLPENAELLAALGILDVVAAYNLSVLEDSNISIELLPPPVADPVAEAPSDIDTGGQAPSSVPSGDATIEETTTGETSTISTEPGSGAAPASGSTGTAAADGIGATDGGENPRGQSRSDDNVSVDEAPGG
jgi:hypothetical protein